MDPESLLLKPAAKGTEAKASSHGEGGPVLPPPAEEAHRSIVPRKGVSEASKIVPRKGVNFTGVEDASATSGVGLSDASAVDAAFHEKQLLKKTSQKASSVAGLNDIPKSYVSKSSKKHKTLKLTPTLVDNKEATDKNTDKTESLPEAKTSAPESSKGASGGATNVSPAPPAPQAHGGG